MRAKRGVILVIGALLILAALSIPAPQIRPDAVLLPPSVHHPLGTDALGQDLLLQLVRGGASTLLLAGTSLFLSTTIGLFLALVVLVSPRRVSSVLMGLVDVYSSLPGLLWMLLVAALDLTRFVPAPFVTVFMLSLAGWPWVLRLVVEEWRRLQDADFVLASQALGGSRSHILLTTLWPHLRGELAGLCIFQLPNRIMMENTLALLGLGLPFPAVSLGGLLGQSWPHISAAPRLMLAPSIVITALLFGAKSLSRVLRHSREAKFS